MNYSLKCLKGVIWGIIYGSFIGVMEGDTRSLDYSSYAPLKKYAHYSYPSPKYTNLGYWRASGWTTVSQSKFSSNAKTASESLL